MKHVCIFICIFLVTGCLAYEDETCEEEIQRSIKSFVKGKDWKVLFKKYANYRSGYIENDEMGDFLIDIGVRCEIFFFSSFSSKREKNILVLLS